MHLKSLCFYISLGFLATACAPQRAQFVGPRTSASASAKGSSSSVAAAAKPLKFVTSGGLTALTDETKNANLKELVRQWDESHAVLAAGDWREFRKTDLVTRKTETRRQTILGVHNGKAEYQTKNVATGEIMASGLLALNDYEPVRKGVRALAEGNYDDFYAMVTAAMTLQAGPQEAVPDDATVELEVRIASFDPSHLAFRLLLVAKTYAPASSDSATVNPAARKPLRTQSFEVRFIASQPKPFDIAYIAYGKEAPNRVFLNYTNFSPR